MTRFYDMSAVLEQMTAIAGKENVFYSQLDKVCYSRDLSSLPSGLLKTYGEITPDLIVCPTSISVVSEILTYCNRNNIPCIPRGGGSWGLGGVLPLYGGIVLDLNRLNRIIEINLEDEYVILETGVEWKRLQEYLEREAYTCGTIPTSAPVATVGGYLSTGGSSGIGASCYGPVGEHVISMKVILPDGRIVRTNPWDSWIFIGAEGTLGVICEITLKIYRKKNLKHFLIGFDKLDEGLEAVIKLDALNPYFYTFMDKGFIRLTHEKELLAGQNKQPPDSGPSADNELTLFITLEVNEEFIKKEKIIRSFDGTIFHEEAASEEWRRRYSSALRIKSLGPAMLSQDIRVPVRFLIPAISSIRSSLGDTKYCLKGTCSNRGSVNVIPILLTDERNQPDFYKTLSYLNGVIKTGIKFKGSFYGSGLFNSNQMHRLHGDATKVMRDIKKHLDPGKTMNPYKTVSHVIPAFFADTGFFIMRFFPELFAWMMKIFPGSLSKLFLVKK